jgi:hypothetical protein
MPAQKTIFEDLVNTAVTQGNPIGALRTFLENEANYEKARQVNRMRFVGYVLELGYENAKIITSDPYKIAVGGIPRGSFLIMTPNTQGGLPPHFTLLRVTGVSPTPLSNQVQQTYFELHKKAMPELDVWTQSELQWGALDCDVLGMFYANPTDTRQLSFSGDVNNVVSAHRYKVFAPDELLLNLIVNGTVKPIDQQVLGKLRTMECGLVSSASMPAIPVCISMVDFRGCRTAMFGKTRLGKSNVVKLIAQGMLEATKEDNSVGQLIFDINGEYANGNPQDGNKSIRSANDKRCHVYALVQRPGTPSKPLRLNFYEQPESCIGVLASLLQQDKRDSIYIRAFASVVLPSIESILRLDIAERDRPVRKIQFYWAILAKGGFNADEGRLRRLGLAGPNARDFSPSFSQALRDAAYKYATATVPPHPTTLQQLVDELEVIATFAQENPKDKTLRSTGSGDPIFDPQDLALLKYLTGGGAGPTMLQPYTRFHAANASDFSAEILTLLDAGRTVILDLGNATDEFRRYFADMLSRAVFAHQETKFVSNDLGNRFVQLYFEEAHNLFPVNDKDLTGVYARFAKEGAKFHVGMVYSTQSPSTINRELLVQTENFFVGHLASQDETKALTRVQIAFAGIEQDILRAKTPGYMRMLTLSHRFVVPMQANKFEAAAPGGAVARA